MSVVHIEVPYVDTSATRLGFALGLPALDTLGDLVIPDAVGPASTLTLRLLGASHQVLLDTHGGLISETVACLDGVDTGLPESLTRSLAGGRYQFHARVRRVAPLALRREADSLRARLADRPEALVGTFPGSPDAMTALLAACTPGAVRWRTWHFYPQTGEVAHTMSTVRVPGPTEAMR
jgi:hypothetical protein